MIGPNLPLAQVDRIFIAANVKQKELKEFDMPDRDMCRYQFFESFVRIVDSKYFQPKTFATFEAGLQELSKKYIE